MADDLTQQLKDISLDSTKKPATSKASYDKTALKERWKILGKDAEQSILSAIRRSCFDTFARKDFGTTLQMIKHSFVDRDYEGIFTDASNLDVYSAAYVPGRAVCYYEIFSMPPLLKLLMKKTRIYAVGSGSGSELVSLSAAMTRVPGERQRIQLYMQDIGEWQSVLDKFEKYTARAWQITSEQLTCTYQQGDILDPITMTTTTAQQIASADLITFMFVMNELFVKKQSAMSLIQTLVASMKKGAYLLVVESAGSFSHLKVGNKTYMVYTLLDAIPDFECVISEDSRWYRCSDQVKYPLPVANMRYFIRLYRKK
ncbi:uncharacterized protein BX664DRAFT_280052 [Halteromyces radiatus]|uniref:uncharacterized protein n=1 Tax=Halteromyces radiatus TaxID=101107 RepID=UPI0022206C24|nr:uncharacterized protein BX664DRAFT_280052 [Halteromyces radiatus]KAI8089239.1 hypothetical protein BX664DRAFT_280052 [Halteromyces radiatus]